MVNMKKIIIAAYILSSTALCQSCNAESQTSYDLAVQQAEKFEMPVVVSHKAIQEYNQKKNYGLLLNLITLKLVTPHRKILIK